MKTLVSFIIVTGILFASCGNNQSKEKEKTIEIIEHSSDKDNFEASKDCDKFLDQYEEWMDNYVVVVEKYLKNPMDKTLAQEFQQIGLEGAKWTTQWNSKLMYCASIEKYQKRIDAITEKAEKKLKKLGIK